MLLDKVAVEDPENLLLGDAFGEVEVVLLERLYLRQPCALDPALKRPLSALRGFAANEVSDDLEEGPTLLGRLIEDFLVDLGDASEPQGLEVTQELLVEVFF